MERPCIKVCRYDEQTGWCLGCGMTKAEKKVWKKQPVFQPAIHHSLPGRLSALAEVGFPTRADAHKKKANR
ncbi:DUF1289 domain-containing protein [Pseudoroseomonas globiformis]|uniref:DUF1289 domain-containing protein n=1 Tax=Teichococcus globiformis TaxID=2307229 RepID=A0ABV7G6P2_9PROT